MCELELQYLIIVVIIAMTNTFSSTSLLYRSPTHQHTLHMRNSYEDNSGIKVIFNDDDLSVIWKTSNVAIKQSEYVKRAASVSVEEWATTNFRYNYIFSTVGKCYSGLLLVAKSVRMRTMIEKNIPNMIFTYCVILQQESAEVHRKLDFCSEISFCHQREYKSKTYYRITHCSISISGSSKLSSVDDLCEYLTSAGLKIIDFPGPKPYVALVKIRIDVNNSCVRYSNCNFALY